MGYLLVTNDFPPKVGGIQSYLYELFRRLPPRELTVFTTAYPGAAEFDRRQCFRVERSRSPVLLPTPGLARRVRELSHATGAGLVLLDPSTPARPPRQPAPVALRRGPARSRGGRSRPAARLSASSCGSYCRGHRSQLLPATIRPSRPGSVGGARKPRFVVVPPGVDQERFHPLGVDERVQARRRLGLPTEGRLVVSVSRLVPRKGMDVLIEAVGRLSDAAGPHTRDRWRRS